MANLKDLIVSGPARFLNKIYGNLEGNSSTTSALKNKIDIKIADPAGSNFGTIRSVDMSSHFNLPMPTTATGFTSITSTNFIGTVTKVNITDTNSPSGTTYMIPFISGIGSQGLLANDGIGYWSREGTTSVPGIGELKLGNSKTSDTVGNKKGYIYMYGASSGYTEIIPGNNTANNVIVYLPSSEGTIALTTSNITGSSRKLSYPNQLTTDDLINNFNSANTFQVSTWNNTSSPGVSNGIIINAGWTSDSYGAQIAIDDDPTYYIALRQKGTDGWNTWKRIPMGDGTGASGTWGISITGNAATATALTSSAGSDRNPIYFSSGKPVICQNIWTGTNSSTTSEGSIGSTTVAGTIYLYSNGKTGSNSSRGLYGINSSGSQVSILTVDDSNTVALNGNAKTATTATYALKMQTYKQGSTTETYGTSYPLYAQWETSTILKLKCDNFTVKTDTANTLATARTLTIGNTGKTFDGSANVSWSLSEIGAASSSHTHNYADSSSAGGVATSSYSLSNKGTLDTQDKIDNFLTSNKVEYATFKTTDSNNIDMASNDGMILSLAWTSNTYGAQIAFDDTLDGLVKVRGKNTNWGDWYTLLHSGNYNSYAPSKTGTGASGTWGISVTGSSASAAKDGSGNTITSYYCTLSTAQTITGAKTFNASPTITNSSIPSILLIPTYTNSGSTYSKAYIEGSYSDAIKLWIDSDKTTNKKSRRGLELHGYSSKTKVAESLRLRQCDTSGSWLSDLLVYHQGNVIYSSSEPSTSERVTGMIWLQPV